MTILSLISTLASVISFLFDFLILPFILIIIFALIIAYHFFRFFFRDKEFISALDEYISKQPIKMENLKDLPQVNILIPAWKEGRIFNDNLVSITKMAYPKLKIIINAGGDEKTVKIAKKFEEKPNFIILHQKKGGKIKAYNDCFKFIEPGVVYLTDADVLITDDLILRMIYPIMNKGEFVCLSGDRPLEGQLDYDLVKYILINRNPHFLRKFTPYVEYEGDLNSDKLPALSIRSGASFSLTSEVIDKVGKFKENRDIAEDISRAVDIIQKGYKLYRIADYEAKIPTDYVTGLKQYSLQNVRYLEEMLMFKWKNNKKSILKFLLLLFSSLYLLLFPFLSFFDLGFMILGFLLLSAIYLKNIRKLIFFKITTPKKLRPNFGVGFFIKLIIYIYTEALTNLYVILEFIFARNKVKERHEYLL